MFDDTTNDQVTDAPVAPIKVTAADRKRVAELTELAEDMGRRKMDLAKLKTDTKNYQCVLDPARVARIVKNFFLPAVNVIVLAERVENGEVVYYILNGQHTRAALLEVGITKGDCIILKGLDIPDEALAFLVLNDKDTHVAPSRRKGFPARVTSGEKLAVKLSEILTETKTPLGGRSKSAFTSLPVLETCFLYDKGSSLRRGLYIVKRAFPGIKVPGTILHAVVGIVYGSDGHFEEDRFVEKLQSQSPTEWSNIVKEACNGVKPNAHYMPLYYATQFIGSYNHNLTYKTGRRLSDQIPLDATVFKQNPVVRRR